MSDFIFKDIVFEQCGCLGKGKSGYSWLVRNQQGQKFVIKQIHHEPCSYYQFGDKLAAELHAYTVLKDAGLRIPQLYDVDHARELILKEYIEGPTIDELVNRGEVKPTYIEQAYAISVLLRKQNLNIDYYPTNFVVHDDLLYYVDYEFNAYDETWSFETWGIQYWLRDPKV